MQSKLKYYGVDYYSESKSAFVYFKIQVENKQDACLMASIHPQCGCGDPIFMLFSGNPDWGLVKELQESDENTRKGVFELAFAKGVDTNDVEDLDDFLHELEHAASKLVPHSVWQKVEKLCCASSRHTCM
ncbi:MAG: hypothetical protein VB032_05580 [Burkholderiaceae bacterium]|nr:hypothetical protein [Burkholderiaceae bacterium]